MHGNRRLRCRLNPTLLIRRDSVSQDDAVERALDSRRVERNVWRLCGRPASLRKGLRKFSTSSTHVSAQQSRRSRIGAHAPGITPTLLLRIWITAWTQHHSCAAIRWERRREEMDCRVVGSPISTRKRFRKFLTRSTQLSELHCSRSSIGSRPVGMEPRLSVRN